MKYLGLAVVVLCCLVSEGLAQDIGNDGYDALDAGRDAYFYHESLRRQAHGAQLGLNQVLRDRAAWPGYSWSALENSYGGGYYNSGYYGASRNVFEPWPVIPGDIWGFPYYRATPQPLGQRQTQTGPNRWESHPVWPESPAAAPAVPLRPVESAPRTSAEELWERFGPA